MYNFFAPLKHVVCDFFMQFVYSYGRFIQNHSRFVFSLQSTWGLGKLNLCEKKLNSGIRVEKRLNKYLCIINFKSLILNSYFSFPLPDLLQVYNYSKLHICLHFFLIYKFNNIPISNFKDFSHSENKLLKSS